MIKIKKIIIIISYWSFLLFVYYYYHDHSFELRKSCKSAAVLVLVLSYLLYCCFVGKSYFDVKRWQLLAKKALRF